MTHRRSSSTSPSGSNGERLMCSSGRFTASATTSSLREYATTPVPGLFVRVHSYGSCFQNHCANHLVKVCTSHPQTEIGNSVHVPQKGQIAIPTAKPSIVKQSDGLKERKELFSSLTESKDECAPKSAGIRDNPKIHSHFLERKNAGSVITSIGIYIPCVRP